MTAIASQLIEIRDTIDTVFGEGYAAANPFLIDRLLAQEFRRGRGVINHAGSSVDRVNSAYVQIVLGPLREMTLMGIAWGGEVSTDAVHREAAKALNVQCTAGFKTSFGRFLTTVFSLRVRKDSAGSFLRPRMYVLPPYDEAVRQFETITGVEV